VLDRSDHGGRRYVAQKKVNSLSTTPDPLRVSK
jgi:hypothetical protein